MEHFSDLKAKLIYVMRIPYDTHKGCVKIGEATADDGDITLQNTKELNFAAKARIKGYTQTAGIPYEILHTEFALFVRDGKIGTINDKAVHDVLKRSGIEAKEFPWASGANEWFACDLETAKKAIAAAKAGRKSLHPTEITEDRSPIQFRPEQREAIDRTLKRFRKGTQMLWNAKMRFGKTLSALQVVKERNDFIRTLILTHRPVVDAGWFEDFGKIFYDMPDCRYGSKSNGDNHATLEKRCRNGECRYVYFASMQDLRGSELVGGNFDKNDEIFSTPWDLIIVDEAHEGTQTELGQNVLKELTKDTTKVLKLSGTPFNLLDDYTEDEIYTWDYVMEQRAKVQWDIDHPGDHNPYAELPRLNIYTYDLGRLMNEYADEDIAFNFREFFRTNDGGEFIHREHIGKFLNLLTKTDEESMYPFANERYRNIFRHTLWMVPGVKEARALSAMLKTHPVFGMFDIVNVAGDGDENEENDDALRMVEDAIGPDPDQTRTITLSCGRLTTGVSVKPWTGVLMLSGTFNTAASAYMQTIFRVQTPATINGRVKEDCYVFDFAPDRTLRVLAETAKVSKKAGKQSSDDRRQLGEFLNFCPIISIEGSQMKQLDTDRMLQQLKQVYVERVVQSGFENNYLYNDELMKLNDIDIREFAKLRGIIGQTRAMGRSNDITVNNQGLTNEEYAEKQRLEKKKKRELTEEEKARLEELKKKKKLRDDASSILRGISIRMPLLIYGADITDEDRELTIDNFTSLVDPQSWEEFMPKGVSKEHFDTFKKYYDPDIFTAAAKRIRQMARAADSLTVEERIERIASIFATFRNPDKETVLTPWRVVNMHMSDTLGGYTFLDEQFSETIEEPRFVDRKEVTADVFAPDSRLLEINSKSGLYPLYLAYNVYRSRLRNATSSPETLKEHQAIWDKTIAENIFVICKTPMAKAITRRTLLGFRKGKTNMWAPDDLINKIKNQPELFIKKVHDLVGKEMKIKAIVGNPPYQEVKATEKASSNSSFATAVYPYFIDMACKLSNNYISLITPSRWMTKQGQGISDEWVNRMLSNENIRIIHDYPDATECFSNVEIKGGINYFLADVNYFGNTCFVSHKKEQVNVSIGKLDEFNAGIIVRDAFAKEIIKRILKVSPTYLQRESFSDMVSPKHYFDRDEQLSSNWKGYSENQTESKSIKYYLNKNLVKSGYAWVSLSDIPKGHETIPLHKIYLPMAGGTGNDSQIIGVPFYGEPNSVCSYTYLIVGYNEKRHNFSKNECANILFYMKSKFFRYMVSVKKKTQNTTRDLFQFVPMQDFTANSDIDWSKSIAEIDQQLYKKYNLTDDEIAFIESMIKPM